ncbi:MAG: ABC transporter permease subunit [Actinomycetes bacterium]
MRALARQVRVELRKTVTTRSVWGLWLGFLVYTAVNVVAQVLASDQSVPQQGVPALDSPQGLRNVFASTASAAVFTLLLGVLSVTSEFRHGTAASTFMAVPRRGRVIAAKALAMPLVGLAYAVTGVAVTVALAWPLLDWKGVSFTASDQLPEILVGCLIAVTLYTVLGVGFGALVRNQVAALTVALLWMLVAESLLVTFLPEVGRWLPGGAASAMTLGQPYRGGELLGQGAGAALFAAYAVVLVLLGTLTTVRRDIT